MTNFNKIVSAKSTRNIIKEVEPLFTDFKDSYQIQDEVFYNMMVAVTEGVNNAAGHGNKYDESKLVTIELTFNEGLLTCKISDQGEGYNPSEVDDPRKPENLLKDSGRGVFLMKSLAQDFEVISSDQGNQVILKFKLK